MKKFFMFFFAALFVYNAKAQFPTENPAEDVIRTKDFPTLKQLRMTAIPGAPILSQPQRIDGSMQEIRTGKHGLCYPALYDWNHDGKLDLILGEFSTGDKENNLKVYLNVGSKKKPKFTGEYFYAKDNHDSIISNHQWCCIGIHPRFVDITGDGKPDILSGQYNPGLVSLWRGTANGFSPREFVPQEGYDPAKKYYNGQDPESPLSNDYWNYTSTGFGDYNGDGLLDLFVGGSGGLRVALNEGTKENPKFGLRKHLLFVDGTPLLTVESDPYHYMIKTYMTPIDWDGDGVLDILATDNYSQKGCNAVSFFRGVKTNLGLRFEKPVPLFTLPDGGKALPGCQPQITVGDINGDGVKDLVFGISIPTYNGYVASDSIAWQWVRELGIEMPGKDAGEHYMYTTLDSLKERIHKSEGDKRYYLGKLTDEKYLTLRHRGYVFVMYGKKNPQQAPAPQTLTVSAPAEIATLKFEGETESPVSYQVLNKLNGNRGEIDVILDIAKGWHAYVDLGDSKKQEFIPTTVEVTLPKGCVASAKVESPYTSGNMYFGKIVFKQFYFMWGDGSKELRESKKMSVKIKVNYQVCNDQMCLPPTEHELEKTFEIE